jgi:hypothetical protein
MLIGSYLSGTVVDYFSTSGGTSHMWNRVWLVPAAGAAAVLLLFALCFRSAASSKSLAAGAADYANVSR